MAREISLTSTIANVEPVAVVYNLSNTVVQDFVHDYLANTKGIAGIEAVRLVIEKEYNGIPKITAALFINRRSEDVSNNSFNINSLIAENLGEGTLKTSTKLQSALSKIADGTKLNASGKRNEPLFIRLNIFKVLGLMLAADPYKHEVRILEAKANKNNAKTFVMAVIKKEKFDGGNNNKNDDKYSQMLLRNRR